MIILFYITETSIHMTVYVVELTLTDLILFRNCKKKN